MYNIFFSMNGYKLLLYFILILVIQYTFKSSHLFLEFLDFLHGFFFKKT